MGRPITSTPPPTPPIDAGVSPLRLGAGKSATSDLILGIVCRAAAAIVVLMLVALLSVILWRSIPSIREFGLSFLTGTVWRANELEQPLIDAAGKVVIEDGEVQLQIIKPVFGALPVIWGTTVSSFIALFFAVPLSFGAALFLVRVAPRLKIAGPVSFLIEFLAAIPSIAYGIWGLFVLAPFLANHVEPAIRSLLGDVPGFGWLFYENLVIGGVGGETIRREIPLTGRDMLCGGLILAIMILPIITAVSRDVLKGVPRTQVEGTLALGATWWQSCTAMLSYSKSGLFGAVMLGLARAAGETMAVTMVIGNNMQVRPSIFSPAQTMSSLLANEFPEATQGTSHMSALLQVALILLIMSLIFNLVARKLVVGKSSRSSAAH